MTKKPLTFKVSEQEEAAIRFRMKIANEKSVNGHVRRLVLNRGSENEALLGDISRRLDRLAASVEHGHDLIREHAVHDQSDVQMSMLAAMCLMLYNAAAPDMKAYVDSQFDVKAVRGFLGDRGERPMPWEVEPETRPVDDVVAKDKPVPQEPARPQKPSLPPKVLQKPEKEEDGTDPYTRGKLAGLLNRRKKD